MSMAGLAESRERQLRAWHRHVRTTVAMELVTALHHSAQRPKSRVVEWPSEEEVHEKYAAPRRRTRPPPGTRPRVLRDLEPQALAATVGYVAAAVPLLAQPVLGGGDTLDAAAVQFILAQTLLQRRREEEEARTEVGEGGGGGGEGEGGAEGEVRGKDAGGEPSHPRRYRHAC